MINIRSKTGFAFKVNVELEPCAYLYPCFSDSVYFCTYSCISKQTISDVSKRLCCVLFPTVYIGEQYLIYKQELHIQNFKYFDAYFCFNLNILLHLNKNKIYLWSIFKNIILFQYCKHFKVTFVFYLRILN